MALTNIVGSSFAAQTANTFLGGATSGGAATPIFRALVAGDLPLTVASGTWTPTISSATGSTGTPTVDNAQYIRIGNYAHVSFGVSFTKNAATVDFTIDLPAAILPSSNFGSNVVGNGPGSTVDDAQFVSGLCFTKSGTKNLRAIASYTGTTGTAQSFAVTIMFLCT